MKQTSHVWHIDDFIIIVDFKQYFQRFIGKSQGRKTTYLRALSLNKQDIFGRKCYDYHELICFFGNVMKETVFHKIGRGLKEE